MIDRIQIPTCYGTARFCINVEGHRRELEMEFPITLPTSSFLSQNTAEKLRAFPTGR